MKHIIWLASWYPDEMNPYNGDFIQRHAHAVASRVPITVIYMCQHGPEVKIPSTEVRTKVTGNLTEILVYFSYRKTGVAVFDKVRYNTKYFFHFRQYIRKYMDEKGRPDLVHVHVPMKAGRIAHWLKENFDIPYIVTEHSSAYFKEVPDNYHNRSTYYRTWVKAIFEQALAVTTVSQKLGKRLRKLFAIEAMHIIPNVADTAHFNYDPKPQATFRLLHASTMDHPKNVKGILRTLHQLKLKRQDWECIMLGWNTTELKQLCSSLQLDGHVQWKGVVGYQQVAAEMKQASALLMFSRYENMPCVILESLCCGLPVIATAVGGIPEVVNEENGLLVEPGNEQQLLEAILKCMDHYARYDRAAISSNAQAVFGYEVVGERFSELYEKIV